jgi:hypothetical protein
MVFILPIILGLSGAATAAYLYYTEDEETDLTVQKIINEMTDQEIINEMTDQEIDEIINEGSTVTTQTYSPVTTQTYSPVTTETPYRPPWINEDGSFNPDGIP